MKKPDINHLLVYGTACPHPKWTKDEVLEHCRQMYREVEALREWIIANMQDYFQDKNNYWHSVSSNKLEVK